MGGMLAPRSLGHKGAAGPVATRSPWQWQLAESRRCVAEVASIVGLDPSAVEGAERAAEAFELRATSYYLSLVEPGNLHDPILRQVLPDVAELTEVPGFVRDAVGDLRPENHPAPGCVQKYPGRVLLVTTGACATNCRFCFRRAFPYDETRAGRDEAIHAIAGDPSVREVILSGGDPLTLTDRSLSELVAQLEAIPHLTRLRIHSRLPVVLPDRITPALVAILRASRLSTWVVTHFNHPRELAPPAISACRRLVEAGIPVLNQAVLLRGVNDDADVLAELSEGLVDVGIKPYYLHQLDRVEGTAHFEVPLDRGRTLVERLRARVSGIAMPAWVRDLPGCASKTPLIALTLAFVLAACGSSSGDPERIEARLSDIDADAVRPSGSDASQPGPGEAAEQPTPPPLDPLRPPPAERVLAADLDGDGTDELLVGGENRMCWGTWPVSAATPRWEGCWEAEGAHQQWVAADLDGDGRQEVVAAFGVGRGYADAPLTVVLLDRKDRSVVVAPIWRRDGERDQVTALAPWPRGDGTSDVYVAAFSDRFTVQGGRLDLASSEPQWLDGHTLRMGMARAVGDFDGDGTPEVAVGRLYGDGPDASGDLRVIGADGRAKQIPTVRGVRAVGSGDLDGDGRPELFFGDGWHKNYGKNARYRPNIARLGADGTWKSELVEERADQYAVEHIGAAGGRLVVGGNQSVSVYSGVDGSWSSVVGPEGSSVHGAWALLDDSRLVVGGATPRLVAP